VDEAHSGTFSWIFKNQMRFTRFLRGAEASSIFWINGRPGSGKSTAMKFAIKHQKTKETLHQFSLQPWVISSYFFHDRGTSIQKSVEGFLQETLYQVLLQRRDLFPFIYPIYSNLQRSGNASQKANLWKSDQVLSALALIAMRAQPSFNLCLFVDALDEHERRHTDPLSVLKDLDELTKTPTFLLRIIVSSRPENIFKDRLGKYLGFSIHKHTVTDINTYIKGRIRDECNTQFTLGSTSSLKSLVDIITERAEGVFLWFRLVMDEVLEGLRKGDTIQELKTLLGTIPS
jgi:hypothetical protein